MNRKSNRNRNRDRKAVIAAFDLEPDFDCGGLFCIDSRSMALGHEKLDVYRLSISYVAWVYQESAGLTGIYRYLRDQWLRASQSIPLNIAEGNGKSSRAERRRYFEIARGSALECAAIQDLLQALGRLNAEQNQNRKSELDRMAMMLSKLGGRGFEIDSNS